MREEDGQDYFDDPEFQDALARYEQARRNGKNLYLDADDLTDIAEHYMLQGREAEADQAIQLALELHPGSAAPQVFLARRHMFGGDLSQAAHICDDIPDQHDPEVHFLRAEIMIRRQQAEQAADYLAACSSDADQPADHLYDSAALFMDYDRSDLALPFARQLVARHPNYPKGTTLLAEIHLTMGDASQAITLLNQTLDRDPYQTDAWNLLAEAQTTIGQYHEAIESTEYLLAIDQDDRQALVTKANCLLRLGQPEQAVAAEKMLFNDNGVLAYSDALALADLERYDEAARRLEQANEAGGEDAPEQLEIYMQQAFVESRLHHLDRAITAIGKARTLAPDDEDYEYELQLGRIYLENGRTDEARVHFRQALADSRDRRKTYYRMGVALADVQYYQPAQSVFEALQETYGDTMQADIAPYLAYCYSQLGEDRKYLSTLKLAASCNPEATRDLFAPTFPGIPPEEYYHYAFRDIYGRFPEEGE